MPCFLVALSLAAHRDPKLEPSHEAALRWWCETMDHEADKVCKLLEAQRSIDSTGDQSQLHGYEIIMLQNAPADEQAMKRTFHFADQFCKEGKPPMFFGKPPRICQGLVAKNLFLIAPEPRDDPALMAVANAHTQDALVSPRRRARRLDIVETGG